MKANSGQAPSTLIPEYIGSDFDKVVAVVDNIESVIEVADNSNHIKTVGNNFGIINTVSSNIDEIVTTSSNIEDVKSVVTNIDSINTVESNLENIVTVADNITDVATVSDNIDYVKDVADGIEGLPVSGYIGDTPPTQPKVGATWYCTLDGRNYTWYKDIDSGQWVESSPQSTVDDPYLAGNIFTLWKRSAAEAGYNLVVGSFEEGGVLTSSTDVLWHKGLDSIYSWTGAYPVGGYVVVPGTDPTVVAGYIPRTDVVLREQLEGEGGADIVYWSQLNNHSLSMTVSSRLRKKIYASDLGITTSTTAAYNTARMQEMVDESSTSGAAVVFDVSCSIDAGIKLKSNCTIFIPRYVTIKVANGVDAPVLTQHTLVGLTNVYVEGGTLDGNQQNAPRAVAVSVMVFGVCSNIVLKNITTKNGSGYGFAFQARPQSTISAHLQGIASAIILDGCHAINNGVGSLSGGDTYDGFDIKYVEGCIITGCSAVGNIDKGFDPRGDRVFMDNCWAISNGSQGFGFSASFSDTGYPVKGSFFLGKLFADGNGASSFFISEGATGNTVRFSVSASSLIGKSSGTQGLRVEAQNADVLIGNLELRTTGSHGVYVTNVAVNSLNVANLLIRDCNANGIVVDATATAPIQFGNIDVIAQNYGLAVYSPEAVIVNGGRLTGITNGPVRLAAAAAVPILNGVVDGDITYKKGDVIANAASTLQLKLGMDKVVISSSSTINNISPMIDNREVTLVSSGSVTYQSSSAMVLKTSPVTITDGMVIKFVAINGKWRQI